MTVAPLIADARTRYVDATLGMQKHVRLGVMGRRTRLGVSVTVGLSIGMSACATWPPPADYRGSVARVGAEPRPLLAGPAQLLHVNADRRTRFTLFRVRTEPGKPVDCGGAPREAIVVLHQGAAVLIRKDETICVAAPGSTHVSWHARPLTGDVETQHAGLDRDERAPLSP